MHPQTRKTAQKGGGIVNRTGNGATAYPIYICLLLRKAEVGQTLVLHLPQQIVLEERLDRCVLVWLVPRVFLPQSLHICIRQEACSEVLGTKLCSAPCLLGAVRGVGGIMCNLLPLVLRRTGSGAALSIHDEISGSGEGSRRGTKKKRIGMGGRRNPVVCRGPDMAVGRAVQRSTLTRLSVLQERRGGGRRRRNRCFDRPRGV